MRSYLKRFLFADDRITTQVKYLSGGERSRLLLARILKNGGNFLILDEPTNDLDLPTLRVLEEALIAFPGIVLVVSHDRYFLNRVCTDILAFEGDGKIHHSVGDYDYYLEKKQAAGRGGDPAERRHNLHEQVSGTLPRRRYAKTGQAPQTFIQGNARTGRHGGANPRRGGGNRPHRRFVRRRRIFIRTHATQTNQLTAELAAAKENLARLYARWEELEAIKAAAENEKP